jgi:hypothetical protein
MPPSTGATLVISPGTTALAAGTRIVGNPLFGATGWASTSPGVISAATLYPFTTGQDEPIILLNNEGIEYQIPFGLSLLANCNMTASFIATWKRVPIEVIQKYYLSI